ncbi:hypothetical protein LMG28688_07254 [Paraburkholderia caffeinitolerans]|uniref:Uncharacterized protein n=1 Tax=Paraburkholderia caffeinitolerans TaxID=1723730 RepID=A0A6J5H1D7_9BURK|nr:hypothetical protein LMG28688_07254 [Paraburkholderia caffeinitolerans]
MLLAGLREPRDGLAHVLDLARRLVTAKRGQQQTERRAQSAPSIAAKLEAFAPWVLPPLVAVDARVVTQTQARFAMVARKLRLLPVLGVIEREMIGRGAVPEAARDHARERVVIGQLPGRHVVHVRHERHHDGPVRIAVDIAHEHLLSAAAMHDRTHLVALPRLRHAHPYRCAAVELALAIPGVLDLHTVIFIERDFGVVRSHDDRVFQVFETRAWRDLGHAVRLACRVQLERGFERITGGSA